MINIIYLPMIYLDSPYRCFVGRCPTLTAHCAARRNELCCLFSQLASIAVCARVNKRTQVGPLEARARAHSYTGLANHFAYRYTSFRFEERL